MFSTCLENFLPFSSGLKLSSANSLSLLRRVYNLSFGNGLIHLQFIDFVNIDIDKKKRRKYWYYKIYKFFFLLFPWSSALPLIHLQFMDFVNIDLDKKWREYWCYKVYKFFLPFPWSSALLLTLSQTSPGFYMSAVQVFWKLWEKEKLLVTSDLSFSYSVFYPFVALSAIFI